MLNYKTKLLKTELYSHKHKQKYKFAVVYKAGLMQG